MHPVPSLAILATLLAAGAAAVAAPQYAVTDLGQGMAYSMNQKGDAGGIGNTPATDPLVFHAGKAKHLGNLGGGTYAIVWGMNNALVSVGMAIDAAGTQHAVKWDRDGTVHDLGVSSIGGVSGAHGIDAQGTIIGSDNNDLVWPSLAAAWVIDPQGVRHAFASLPGGDDGRPGAINLAGQIVGSSNTKAGGAEHCFILTDGIFNDLGKSPDGGDCLAGAVSSNGHVGGSIEVGNGVWNGFVWTGKKIRGVGTLGGDQSDVRGINASGVAVGESRIAANSDTQHPFVWSDGVMTDLTTLLDSSGDKWSKMYVAAIDDQGRIIGTGHYKGAEHAFMLTPLAR